MGLEMESGSGDGERPGMHFVQCQVVVGRPWLVRGLQHRPKSGALVVGKWARECEEPVV